MVNKLKLGLSKQMEILKHQVKAKLLEDFTLNFNRITQDLKDKDR